MNQIATFQFTHCQGVILSNGWHIQVKGVCDIKGNLRYMASSPPDLRMSRAGSALPFANEEMAYQNTPNKGEISIDKEFSISLVQPNSYYKNNGSKLEKPHLHFTIGDQYYDLPLGEYIANRSLSGLPERHSRTTGR
jgi:hypothetical protein